MNKLNCKAGNLKFFLGVLFIFLIFQTDLFAQRANVRKNSIGMEFVSVPSGSFMMGINDVQLAQFSLYDKKHFPEDAKFDWYEDEIPQRRVTVKSFWLARFEVTQAQWQAIMGDNPSHFAGCAQCPVEFITWDSTQEFIKRLNAKNDGYTYRLPTEAEWEYAAKGGTTTLFSFGDTLTAEQANFDGGYPYGENMPKGKFLNKTAPVGSYPPNAFGLYDMQGNVWEWVEDIHSDNYLNLPTDGSANLTVGDKDTRVQRGGSWDRLAWYLRPFNRAWGIHASSADNETGFRIVAVPKI